MSVVRAVASFKSTWSDFKVPARQYSQQYSHVHSKRLHQLSLYARRRAESSTSASPPDFIDRIIELPTGVRTLVCGTIVKNIVRRKEVVGDYAEDGLTDAQGLLVAEAPSGGEAFRTQASALDDLVLEDDSGRVQLVLSPPDAVDALGDRLKVCDLVTGVVVCVAGVVQENGDLRAEAIFLPGHDDAEVLKFPEEKGAASAKDAEAARKAGTVTPAHRKIPAGSHSSAAPPALTSVLLCSNLRLGARSNDALSFDLLVDYLSGATQGVGDDLLDATSGAHVCRVIVAGGAGAPLAGAAPGEGDRAAAVAAAQPIKELDMRLEQLCRECPVDLMAGAESPTNFMMPQAPYHPCLLARSSSYNTLTCAPNPYSAVIGGVAFLGSSGQPIADLRKYTASSHLPSGAAADAGELVPVSNLVALERTLLFRHLAPTAPDSLPTYPFFLSDPFVIDVVPDVYFVGCCERFETKLLNRGLGQRPVRLLCIPDFEKTGEVCKVNLETLEVEILQFQV